MSPTQVTACIFTLCFSAVHSAPNIVFPEDEEEKSPTNFSDKLNECLEDDLKIEFQGDCRSLLKPHPRVCPDRHWLVLDLAAASLPKPVIKGKCAPQRCPSDQHYWVDLKRCVRVNESSSLCPEGNTIATDFFGDGFCDCKKNPVHIKDEKTGVCYPAYKRGPCPEDKVWVVEGCRSDNCTSTRARFPNKTIVPWGDGKCYGVNEQGPCKKGHDISINHISRTPECVDRLTSLNLLNPACSGTDHSGQCTRPVSSPQTDFYKQVASQAGKNRN